MIASEKTMDALKSIGLNLYERRIWVALLAKGSASAGELAEISNVPRSRCYDILESLAEKGFAIMQPGKPLKFVAVAPDEALEKLKKKIEQEMRNMQARIDEIKSSPIMKELNEIHKKGLKLIRPEEITGAIRGRFSVYQQLESMFKGAERKINIVGAPEILDEILSRHLDLLMKAKERGVEINVIISSEKIPDTLRALSQIAHVRTFNRKTLPIHGNLVLIDERELLFGLTDPKAVHATQETAFWSRSEYAASSLMSPLFELIWNKSKPIKG
jgi:sugar-specific transcriptional regulator TrmB